MATELLACPESEGALCSKSSVELRLSISTCHEEVPRRRNLWGLNEEFLQILHRRLFQCPKNLADGGDGEIEVPRPECCRVVSVRPVAVTMREHPNYGDGDLPKFGCGLRGPLHSWNGNLSMIHLVVNDAEKLHRAVNGVGAPSMVQTTTSILVVNMLGPVVDKRGPFFAAPWIFGYAILKKVTLSKP